MDHIKYNDNILRPEVGETELEVHKVANQVWNMGKSEEQVVNEYYSINGYLDEIQENDPSDIHDMYNVDFPILTYEMIYDCMKYAEQNKVLIDSIIEEDEKLKRILFGNLKEPEKIQKQIEDQDFKYFNINFKKENEGDGYSVHWG